MLLRNLRSNCCTKQGIEYSNFQRVGHFFYITNNNLYKFRNNKKLYRIERGLCVIRSMWVGIASEG